MASRAARHAQRDGSERCARQDQRERLGDVAHDTALGMGDLDRVDAAVRARLAPGWSAGVSPAWKLAGGNADAAVAPDGAPALLAAV